MINFNNVFNWLLLIIIGIMYEPPKIIQDLKDGVIAETGEDIW